MYVCICEFLSRIMCVEGIGGFWGYFLEQGPPFVAQEVSWRISQTVHWLYLIPKWDNTNAESVFATADITSVLMEIILFCGLDEWRWIPCGIPEDYRWSLTWIHRMAAGNRWNCWRSVSYGTCRRPFTNFIAGFWTFSKAEFPSLGQLAGVGASVRADVLLCVHSHARRHNSEQ